MIRKALLVAALVFGGSALWAGFSGFARTADNEKKATPYVHTVIFYLKKEAPEGEADKLIGDAHELLRQIPSVRDLWAGKPAEMATPNFAKKDFAAGLLVLFDNYEGLKAYLEHPKHREYVERHEKNLDADKLLIFDFVDQKKQ